jgi:hypothetical protein
MELPALRMAYLVRLRDWRPLARVEPYLVRDCFEASFVNCDLCGWIDRDLAVDRGRDFLGCL